ncbi:MAG: poly(R)-hydroxyalkanoic acid synthase subunit PhaE, partial [Rudaea sp.]
SQRGFELFDGKLAERSEPGRAIDSLRALYDLWVDAAEEAYAEVALSDEFAKVYGELANAQMRARAQIQAEVERVSTDLGMPTRSELNSVHKRLHDLRRELRDGGRAQTDAGEVEIAASTAEVKEPKRSAPRESLAVTPKAAAAPVTAQSQPARRRTVTKPRPPAPVVRPHPVAALNEKSTNKGKTSFGDAIAAMRRRVVGKPGKLKAVAAGMSKPSKQNKSANKKTGKRRK